MARVRLAWLPPNEAEVACGVLVSGGLDAVVVGAARSALMGALPPTDFQVELWVEEAQVTQARELLSATPVELPTASEPEPPRVSKPSKFPMVVLLLIIAGLSYALWREKQSHVRTMVCVTTWLGGAKHLVHCDANRDGNDERVEVYDRQGRLRTLWLDSDEDGNAERVDEFGANGELLSRGSIPRASG